MNMIECPVELNNVVIKTLEITRVEKKVSL